MLAKPTTFILGAGASYELLLPTGDGLQKKIAKILELGPGRYRFQNERVRTALQEHSANQPIPWPVRESQYEAAAAKIIAGMSAAASIDNFLHTHSNDEDIVFVGKLAIALSILEAEENSIISAKQLIHKVNNEQYESSWYYPFWRMLTMGTLSGSPEDLLRNARFVVFNYDRCLELQIIRAFTGYYGLSEQAALDLLATVDIVHPYGSLGALQAVHFGNINTNLVEAAGRIKTFTETVETATRAQAIAAISAAEVLVFLGFGYLPQNLTLISPGDERKAKKIHATTFGFSETDKLGITEKLKSFISPTVELGVIEHVAWSSTRSGFIDISNNKCRDLIDNHRMRLVG